MNKLLYLLSLALALSPRLVAAQKAGGQAYLQIFYDGPNWTAGRALLHYSPAFRSKTQETVVEPDSTRLLSPMGSLFGSSSIDTVFTGQATFTSVAPAFGQNSKTKQQTAADIRKKRQKEQNELNRALTLIETRTSLARNALTKALNDAAADGWEVVQMTSYGNQGGLVYLLRRRQ